VRTFCSSTTVRFLPFPLSFSTLTFIFVFESDFGCCLKGETREMVGEKITWQTSPFVVLPLTPNKIICIGQRQVDVFSRRTGAILESTQMEAEARKIRFLLKQTDGRDIVLASKIGDGNNIYIIRSTQKQDLGEAPLRDPQGFF